MISRFRRGEFILILIWIVTKSLFIYSGFLSEDDDE
jgi:hypothetical protein